MICHMQLSRPTLCFSPDQTDWERVLGVLRPVLTAHLPRLGLFPAGKHDEVTVDIIPALPVRTEMTEVPRVGVGLGQPQKDQKAGEQHIQW